MDTLTRLQGLSDEHKTTLRQRWPDELPRNPEQWTPQHRKRIDDFLDRLTGFNAEADPAVMATAKKRVADAMKAANVTGRDQLAAVVAYCDADQATAAGLELIARTLDRVKGRELVVHIDDDNNAWTVTEAGAGTELAHRRAVTDASTTTGEWVAVVTIQHPAGHHWTGNPHTIRGGAAKAIADIVNKEQP